MAERLIRESDVIENIDEWLDGVGVAYVAKGFSYYAELKGCIADAPTIEAKPVVHAHWNDDGRCTNCGEHAPWIYLCEDWYESKYCHGCGAQMDEVVE